MPTLLLFADHDAVSMRHIAEFFALFDGGVRDAGWEGKPKYARARLAIVPGYTHYNFGQGPDMARVIEAYLDQPTSRPRSSRPDPSTPRHRPLGAGRSRPATPGRCG